jgi:hypothetical protein
MESWVLVVHSLVRWVVVVAGVAAALRALSGWRSKKAWLPIDDRLGRLFTLSLDVQVVLGLALFFFLSEITAAALDDVGAAMAARGTRYWLIEHQFAMLVALVLAHIGRARSARATEPERKHKLAAQLFTLAVLIVLIGMPWPFLDVGRPLLPAF